MKYGLFSFIYILFKMILYIFYIAVFFTQYELQLDEWDKLHLAASHHFALVLYCADMESPG